MAFYIGFYAYAIIVHSRDDQLLPQLLMEQLDTFPIQCRHIEHMHEWVWFRKNIFWQNDSCENLDNFSLISLLYMHRWCLHGPINSYHSLWWSNLILCLYNIDTLNLCIREFDSEKIIIPATNFEVGILFSQCQSVCLCVRPSAAFYFLNILKSHCWIFIKPCKHVYICKTNTFDKKVRARGQFY